LAEAPVAAVEPEEDSEHRVGWLELFYDLVFVVLIAALAHRLHGHPPPATSLWWLG
jgi:low temperature requirement protein LtrA